MRRRLNCVFAGLCCAALAGCYQKASANTGTAYSFEPWVPLLVLLAGLAAVPVAVVLWVRKQRFWGACLAVVGPLAAGVLAPMMYQDRVVVNDEGFSSRHGFWWDPTVHKIRYDDLGHVQLVVEERTTRRGKSYSCYFDCSFKSGKRERVPLGDLMREALPEIAEQFRKHGVSVDIPPSLPN